MDYKSKQGKEALIEKHSPKSHVFKNCSLAFLFGGMICVGAELLRRLFINIGASEELAGTLVSITLIGIASLLTAVGVFDRIAKRAGAGTLVPITGFANSITSEAVDSRSEGFILGVGAKIFTVAGPVILYGIFSGVIYGIIYAVYVFVSNRGIL